MGGDSNTVVVHGIIYTLLFDTSILKNKMQPLTQW